MAGLGGLFGKSLKSVGKMTRAEIEAAERAAAQQSWDATEAALSQSRRPEARGMTPTRMGVPDKGKWLSNEEFDAQQAAWRMAMREQFFTSKKKPSADPLGGVEAFPGSNSLAGVRRINPAADDAAEYSFLGPQGFRYDLGVRPSVYGDYEVGLRGGGGDSISPSEVNDVYRTLRGILEADIRKYGRPAYRIGGADGRLAELHRALLKRAERRGELPEGYSLEHGPDDTILTKLSVPDQTKFSLDDPKFGGPTLDMSQEARMARADEMFPVTAYRGTREPMRDYLQGPEFWSASARTANTYIDPAAEGGTITKGRLQPGRSMEVDFGGRPWHQLRFSDIPDEKIAGTLGQGSGPAAVARAAQDKGYDSVVFKNIIDDGPFGAKDKGEPSTVYAILNGKNRRASTAAFDPAKKDSPDLLASALLGTTALGGATALGSGEAEAGPFGGLGKSALRRLETSAGPVEISIRPDGDVSWDFVEKRGEPTFGEIRKIMDEVKATIRQDSSETGRSVYGFTPMTQAHERLYGTMFKQDGITPSFADDGRMVIDLLNQGAPEPLKLGAPDMRRMNLPEPFLGSADVMVNPSKRDLAKMIRDQRWSDMPSVRWGVDENGDVLAWDGSQTTHGMAEGGLGGKFTANGEINDPLELPRSLKQINDALGFKAYVPAAGLGILGMSGGFDEAEAAPFGGGMAKAAAKGAERFFDPRLSPQQNKAVEMVRNGYSRADVADEMDIDSKHLGVLLSQARKRGVEVEMGAPPAPTKDAIRDLLAKNPALNNMQVAERLRGAGYEGLTAKTVSVLKARLRADGVDLPRISTGVRADALGVGLGFGAGATALAGNDEAEAAKLPRLSGDFAAMDKALSAREALRGDIPYAPSAGEGVLPPQGRAQSKLELLSRWGEAPPLMKDGMTFSQSAQTKGHDVDLLKLLAPAAGAGGVVGGVYAGAGGALMDEIKFSADQSRWFNKAEEMNRQLREDWFNPESNWQTYNREQDDRLRQEQGVIDPFTEQFIKSLNFSNATPSEQLGAFTGPLFEALGANYNQTNPWAGEQSPQLTGEQVQRTQEAIAAGLDAYPRWARERADKPIDLLGDALEMADPTWFGVGLARDAIDKRKKKRIMH